MRLWSPNRNKFGKEIYRTNSKAARREHKNLLFFFQLYMCIYRIFFYPSKLSMFMQMKFESSWIKQKVNFKYNNGITPKWYIQSSIRYVCCKYIFIMHNIINKPRLLKVHTVREQCATHLSMKVSFQYNLIRLVGILLTNWEKKRLLNGWIIGCMGNT